MTLTKVYKGAIFLLIVACLCAFSFATGLLLEFLIMLPAFIFAKEGYQHKYHCKSALQCAFVSVCVFILGLRVTLPVGYSYTCAGLCGVFIAYFAQGFARNKFIQQDYAYIEPRYNALMEQKYAEDIYSMDEEGLRNLCRKNLLDEVDEAIVIHRLLHHLKGQELYTKIGYSKAQMIRREKRIEKTLGVKLKDR